VFSLAFGLLTDVLLCLGVSGGGGNELTEESFANRSKSKGGKGLQRDRFYLDLLLIVMEK
jgi:hypothetical protein